jgi:torulene dioxygenase
MASAIQPIPSKPYNNYWVGEDDLKYVPPYFRDVPETTQAVTCETKGTWPAWVKGTFVRWVLEIPG